MPTKKETRETSHRIKIQIKIKRRESSRLGLMMILMMSLISQKRMMMSPNLKSPKVIMLAYLQMRNL